MEAYPWDERNEYPLGGVDMTVVLEDQVKTITAEISEQFGDPNHPALFAISDIEIEDVVRAVIAQYDISNIARLEAP
jgi:hypothetical protein